MSLFTFLVLEIVTADLCVTGLSEDLWGFSDIVEFSQSILKHDTSEHILCQSQAFRPPLFFGGGHSSGIWKFPSQGSNLSHSCVNPESLTHCPTVGTPPRPSLIGVIKGKGDDLHVLRISTPKI